jgi:hypothetical protein
MFYKPILRLKVMTSIVSRYPGFRAIHSLTARYTIIWTPKSEHLISNVGIVPAPCFAYIDMWSPRYLQYTSAACAYAHRRM